MDTWLHRKSLSIQRTATQLGARSATIQEGAKFPRSRRWLILAATVELLGSAASVHAQQSTVNYSFSVLTPFNTQFIPWTADSAGNVYAHPNTGRTIMKITPDGNSAAFVTGFSPYGAMTIDRTGNIYYGDNNANTISKITPAGTITIVGRQVHAAGLAVDSGGNIFATDSSQNIIVKVTPTGTVTTFAGVAGLGGYLDGTGTRAMFYTPWYLAIDSFDNLYVSDDINCKLRKVTPAGVVTTVAGADTVTYPSKAVGVDDANNIFQENPISNTIKRFSPSGAIGVIAGRSFTSMDSITMGAGKLYVANGNIIYVGVPIGVPSIQTQPTAQTVTVGYPVSFTVASTSTLPVTYQWLFNGVAISGATAATYSIPSALTTHAGSYRVVVTNDNGSITSSTVGLTVTLPVPSSVTARIINLSILTSLASAGDNFTLGYVVANSSTANPLSVVIRAGGPALGALGFPGTMADPKLELFAGATKTGENDNWGGSATLVNAFTSVGAFAYPSATSKDAAMLANITSQDNSVKVSATDNGTGAVIAEVYDSTATAKFNGTTPRLINVSVLKPIATSLTVGFVLGGTGTKNVLIRAIGPTLNTLFGLPAASVIADPKLELFDGKSVSIGTNDNWGGNGALSTAFTAAGAFGLSPTSLDAALSVTLSPGNYTVVVKPSATTATGTGLVEVYELP